MENVLDQRIETVQLVTFTVNEEIYGSEIIRVQEIIWLTAITRVPKAQEHIIGVINLRGQIIPINSLAKRLKLKKDIEQNELSRIVIFKTGELVAGVIVDSVSEVIRVPLKNIEPAPEINADKGSNYIQSVAKMSRKIVIILDVDKIILGDIKDDEGDNG